MTVLLRLALGVAFAIGLQAVGMRVVWAQPDLVGPDGDGVTGGAHTGGSLTSDALGFDQGRLRRPAALTTTDNLWTVGSFLGVHRFSPQSALGAVSVEGATLSNSILLGLRLGYALTPSLTLEGALPVLPTSARDGDITATVVVLEPQIHLRLGGGTVVGTEPFALVGAGLPVALSSDRAVVANDVLGSLQAGAGVALARTGNWGLRFELQAAILPARGVALAAFDFAFVATLERRFARTDQAALGPTLESTFGTTPESRRAQTGTSGDADGDGLPDERDRCPNQDEDRDGFEDEDGCPDIDDDGDQILDVADGCRLGPEVINGFRDDDGCPDQIPSVLRTLGDGALRFRTGRPVLRRPSRLALTEIAQVLIEYSSVRILILGHSTGAEAREPGAAEALSLRRAEVVRDALIELGLPARRFEVWGLGTNVPAPLEGALRRRVDNRRVTLRVLQPGVPIPAQVESFLAGDAPPEESFP